MDEKKIIKLFDYEKNENKKDKEKSNKAFSSPFQTNSIIERMIEFNNKKDKSKFSFKDLFK